jgi:Fe-S-cluster formation regulator IscX/YfhJ
MNRNVIIALVVGLLLVGGYFYWSSSQDAEAPAPAEGTASGESEAPAEETPSEEAPVEEAPAVEDQAAAAEEMAERLRAIDPNTVTFDQIDEIFADLPLPADQKQAFEAQIAQVRGNEAAEAAFVESFKQIIVAMQQQLPAP